jgi:hypothetical protein
LPKIYWLPNLAYKKGTDNNVFPLCDKHSKYNQEAGATVRLYNSFNNKKLLPKITNTEELFQ